MYDYKQRVILKSALKIISRYGLRAVNMDDIAHGAGMSKKTIYQWFNDKHHVIDSLYENIIQIVQHRLDKIETNEPDSVHRYIKIIELAAEARQYISSSDLEELRRFHAPTYKKIEQFVEKSFASAFTHCIDLGREQEMYERAFNSTLVAMISLSALNFLNRTDKQLAELSSHEKKQQVTRHLLYAITTPAGKKKAEQYFSNNQS